MVSVITFMLAQSDSIKWRGLYFSFFFLAQDDERQLLNWLVDEETLEIPGKIEKVNPVMLQNILDEEPNVVVYFYAEDYDKKAADILKVNV